MTEPPDALPDPDPLWRVVAAVAAGGALGSLARYGVAQAVPARVSTLLVNAAGCLVIGVLLGLLDSLAREPRLVRPLLGAGFCGGFTTYSTYALDVVGLIREHRYGIALLYLAGTVAAALVAVALGAALGRRAAA